MWGSRRGAFLHFASWEVPQDCSVGAKNGVGDSGCFTSSGNRWWWFGGGDGPAWREGCGLVRVNWRR